MTIQLTGDDVLETALSELVHVRDLESELEVARLRARVVILEKLGIPSEATEAASIRHGKSHGKFVRELFYTNDVSGTVAVRTGRRVLDVLEALDINSGS